MSLNIKNRTIFEGDNIDILRGINSESVDLVYLDPPFNSNANYSAPIGSKAAGAAFKDSWTLDDIKDAEHLELAEKNEALYQVIDMAGMVHGKGMKAYLIMMSLRLIELHRILKPTGSIYLHCDPTASHYLKMVMDAIFKLKHFRNEIVWQRASGRSKGSQFSKKTLGRDTDNIFHYTKTNDFINNPVYQDLSAADMKKKFPHIDENGRRYNTGTPLFCQPSMGDRPNLCYEYRGVVNPTPSGWRVSKERPDRDGQGGRYYLAGRQAATKKSIRGSV